jgi:membrane glycosyltransferase
LPPDLLEELERDNRWCQGNIQHLRLMFMRGVSFGHRLLFLNGNMFYLSSLLWLLLLVLTTAYAVFDAVYKPDYFPQAHSLFPQWPVRYQGLSMHMLLVTAVFLFAPKILSVFWIFWSGRNARPFGGWGKLIVSILLETFFSVLLAPIRMLFHSWFVVANMMGRKLEWNKQRRQLKEMSFKKAWQAFGLGTMAALIWGLVAFEINESLFLWLTLIVVPLALSIPIALLTSYPPAGLFFKNKKIFLTPPELNPVL